MVLVNVAAYLFLALDPIPLSERLELGDLDLGSMLVHALHQPLDCFLKLRHLCKRKHIQTVTSQFPFSFERGTSVTYARSKNDRWHETGAHLY